ncbi:MAG TPA: hypothetical protein VIY47_15435, partial [Ignavibacteriaceae bacterium]
MISRKFKIREGGKEFDSLVPFWKGMLEQQVRNYAFDCNEEIQKIDRLKRFFESYSSTIFEIGRGSYGKNMEEIVHNSYEVSNNDQEMDEENRYVAWWSLQNKMVDYYFFDEMLSDEYE